MAARGVDVSYETIRCWTIKFGPAIARNLRRAHPLASPRWHLDEMVVKIASRRMYLWRAVDDEGVVLDMLVQRRSNTAAALKLLRKLLKNQGVSPQMIVTDGLRSYGAALGAGPGRPTPTWAATREQSHRVRPPAAAPARTDHAALQVARLRPALPRHPRRRLQRTQPPASPDLPSHPLPLPKRRGQRVGRSHRSRLSPSCAQPANLTKLSSGMRQRGRRPP